MAIDIHPKCPQHGQSTYIQLDAQSHIMACQAKQVSDHWGAYWTPDTSSCSWVSDEFRRVGDLVFVIPNEPVLAGSTVGAS